MNTNLKKLGMYQYYEYEPKEVRYVHTNIMNTNLKKLGMYQYYEYEPKEVRYVPIL